MKLTAMPHSGMGQRRLRTEGPSLMPVEIYPFQQSLQK